MRHSRSVVGGRAGRTGVAVAVALLSACGSAQPSTPVAQAAAPMSSSDVAPTGSVMVTASVSAIPVDAAAAAKSTVRSTARSRATSKPAPRGLPAVGSWVGSRALASRMTAAIDAATGCSVHARTGAGTLSGALSFGHKLRYLDMLVDYSGQGEYTTRVGTTRYVANVHPPGGEIYVTDGMPIGGRLWARLPDSVSGVGGEQSLKNHPMFMATGALVVTAVPMVAANALSATDRVRVADLAVIDGVRTAHYAWPADERRPKERINELWVDDQGRPLRYVSRFLGNPMTVTYSHWGPGPRVQAPPDKDVAILPTASS